MSLTDASDRVRIVPTACDGWRSGTWGPCHSRQRCSIVEVSSVFLLEHGFNRMSVWIDHEGGVVGRPVMGSNARKTIIGSSSPQCFGMEGVDRSVRCGGERKVKSGARGRHR